MQEIVIFYNVILCKDQENKVSELPMDCIHEMSFNSEIVISIINC